MTGFERRVERIAQLFDTPFHHGPVFRLDQQTGEFIGSEARYVMSVDLQETHAIGNRAEQFIAGGMSGNLINLRKAIDVEEYERTAGSAGLRVVVERFEQLVTIEQTGERIVGREKQYRVMR